MPQNEAVMVSFSGVTYFTHSTTTSSTFTQYVEQEPPLWPPSLPQFQLMRNPTAQSLVGLGPPVTGNYTAYPEQQHTSITPRAERQTNGKYIELSNFPSEEGVIDGLLPIDERYQTTLSPADLKKAVSEKYTPEPHFPAEIPSQTEKRTRKRRIYFTYNAKAELIQRIRAGDKKDAELAEEYNVSVGRVQVFRRNIGMFLRPPRKKEKVLSGEEKDKLKQDLRMDERLSDDELQKKYNISSTTLRRVKKSAGLDTKKDHKKLKKLTMDEELNLIDDLCKEGIARLSNADLAQKYNISTDTIRRRVKKHQLQQKNYLRNVSDNFQRDSPFMAGSSHRENPLV